MNRNSISTTSARDTAPESLSRRGFILRSGVLVATAASISLSSSKLEESAAYTAWKQFDKGQLTDFEYIVQCGTLAANAHNTQAWLFHIAEPQIVLYADLKRHLGRADPKRRLMLMSLGCAVENMRIAAHQLGYTLRVNETDLANFSEGQGRCAVLELTRRRDSGSHPWFPAVFSRRTARTGFLGLPEHYSRFAATIGELTDLPGIQLAWYQQPAELQAIVNAVAVSVQEFVNDDGAYRDAMMWFRRSRSEWEYSRDGISIFSGDAPFWVKEWVDVFAQKADLLQPAFRNGELDVALKLATATPLWAILQADVDQPQAWFRAGRLLERIYLAAAAEGYAVQPMVYPTESAVGRALLTSGLGLGKNQLPLVLLRVGRSITAEPTPRRELAAVLI